MKVALERVVLEAKSRIFGKLHPNSLIAAGNLAQTLSKEGSKESEERAMELQGDALEGAKRVLGDDHPITLTSEGNYARILSRKSEHAEAATIQRRVLAVQRKVLGAEHPDALRTAARLGVSLNALGHAVRADFAEFIPIFVD
jgi:hypothetical protein